MLLQRLMAGITMQPDTGCWEWQRSTTDEGYGRIKVQGKVRRAHMLMQEIHQGPIPKGMVVCHDCDNPPCCNPEHLFLDTHQGNMDDRQKKGRQPHGSKNGRAKLTENRVRRIKLLLRVKLSDAYLAKKFEVSRSAIQRIRTGKTWAKV